MKFANMLFSVHLCALLVRKPKIYLLTVENEDTCDDNTNSAPLIRQFLCHRFEHLELRSLPNCVPEDFNVRTYLDSGALEALIQALQTSLPEPFTLVIR